MSMNKYRALEFENLLNIRYLGMDIETHLSTIDSSTTYTLNTYETMTT